MFTLLYTIVAKKINILYKHMLVASDGVKARDPKAKTTSIKIKAKAVIHRTKANAKAKAPRPTFLKSRPRRTNKISMYMLHQHYTVFSIQHSL